MSNSELSSVIMASGRGTRLNEITATTPKPMLEFGGKPYLHYLIDWQLQSGVDDIVVTTHYLGDQIEDYIADHDDFGGRVTVVREPELVNTIESAKAGLAHVKHPTSLLLIADCLWDIDLPDIYEKHKASGADATLVVSDRDDVPNQGLVKVTGGEGPSRQIVRLDSLADLQPAVKDQQATSSMGFYVLNVAKVLASLKNSDTTMDLEPLNRLRPNAYAYVTDTFYLDYGTPDNLKHLQEHPELIIKNFDLPTISNN